MMLFFIFIQIKLGFVSDRHIFNASPQVQAMALQPPSAKALFTWNDEPDHRCI